MILNEPLRVQKSLIGTFGILIFVLSIPKPKRIPPEVSVYEAPAALLEIQEGIIRNYFKASDLKGIS